jgi:hypothetical protein
VNLSHLRFQLAQLRHSLPVQAPLPAGYVDPITLTLRAQIAAGATPTPTTPEAIATAKASLTTRLEEAARNARARAWS